MTWWQALIKNPDLYYGAPMRAVGASGITIWIVTAILWVGIMTMVLGFAKGNGEEVDSDSLKSWVALTLTVAVVLPALYYLAMTLLPFIVVGIPAYFGGLRMGKNELTLTKIKEKLSGKSEAT